MQEQRKGFALPQWRFSLKQFVGLIAALVVIYIVYGIFVQQVALITSTKSLTLAANQSQLIKIYNGSTADLLLRSTSSGGAAFYVTSTPVLYSPVVSFSLSPLTSLNISTSGSKTADMNIRLISSSNSSATVEITPLAVSLGIKPSGGVTLLNPASLGNIGATNVSTSTVSTSTSTAATTTALNSTQSLFQHALSLMNKTGTGKVMKGYAALYKKDVNCTPSVYNSTYIQYHSKKPPAPIDFYNVSRGTPTAITINESKLSKTNVLITYSTVSPSPDTTGTAVQAIINTSSASFVASLAYAGVYAGFNYTILNNSYSFQSKILNDCGAYISPP